MPAGRITELETSVKALAIAILATLLAAPVMAETHKIPEDNPIVTVVVPDKGWSAEKIATGIEVSDDDDEVYIAIQGVDNTNVAATVAGAITYLERQGVTIDASTKKETEGKVGEFEAFSMGWKGKDKDGDVLVNLVIIPVTAQRGVFFTYWASPKGDAEHTPAIRAMVNSIKKVGN
jgi:hypothetical protein